MTWDTCSGSGHRVEMAKVAVFRAWTKMEAFLRSDGSSRDTPFIPLSLADACLLRLQVAFPPLRKNAQQIGLYSQRPVGKLI